MVFVDFVKPCITIVITTVSQYVSYLYRVHETLQQPLLVWEVSISHR